MKRASRSLRVDSSKVSRAKDAYTRSGCFSQKDLAADVGVQLDTVSRFLNGHPVDKANAHELCRRLKLDSDDFLIAGNAEVVLDEADAALAAPDIEPMSEQADLVVVQPASGSSSANAEADAEKVDSMKRINQNFETLKGLAIGSTERFNNQPVSATGQSDSSSGPKSKGLKKLEINQNVKTLEETGILIGSADEINYRSNA